MISNIFRYISTIQFLTFKQLFYQAYYPLRKKIRGVKRHTYPFYIPAQSTPTRLQDFIPAKPSIFFSYDQIDLSFLNKEKKFNLDNINWSFFDHGRLWNYNLVYFDFLNQQNISSEQGVLLIQDFIRKLPDAPTALEPYPISLRGLNWIKFFSKNQIQNNDINASLYAQYKILLDNIEYHLLHNHILDNGFSLIAAGMYFSDKQFFEAGKKIIEKEIEKQILSDGAHFERSPMYHQVLLEHLMDVINFLQNNRWQSDQKFLLLLREKAGTMLGWLTGITFQNYEIPYVNDSAENIAHTTPELRKYSESLGVYPRVSKLFESGYRYWKLDNAEFFFDVGELSVTYQAGHAHADTFSFILHIGGKPFIIDTGTSTYEKCERRYYERSTKAHNTVAYNDENSSDVWGVFRTAKRASVKIVLEEENAILATHDGYKKHAVIHERKFQKHAGKIVLTDEMKGNIKHQSYSYFYFHENVKANLVNNIIISEFAEMTFIGAERIELLDCEIAHGFNRLVQSKACRCTFQKEMSTEIRFVN